MPRRSHHKKKVSFGYDRHAAGGGGGSGGSDNDDDELPPTAGALGKEKARKRKKREPNVDDNDTERRNNAPSARNVLPPKSYAPRPASKNLAGAPDLISRTDMGHKSRISKILSPSSPSNELSHIHFMLQTGATEWVHFPKDSISMVIVAMVRNNNFDPNAVPPAANAIEYNNCTRGAPTFMLDPDVSGRGLFTRAEVIINDKLVPTNDSLGQLFGHYARYQAIFESEEGRRKKKTHFKNLNEWAYANIGDSKIMTRATDMFANRNADDREGQRISVPMDGIFPFDLKSSIHSAIEGVSAQELFFPPSTKFEVKLYYQQSKMEFIFHNEVTAANYYTDAAVGEPLQLRLTVKDIALEYISVELHPARFLAEMDRFRDKNMAYYEYDIPRAQYQSIAPNASFAENTFQINPYCRSLLIAFHPSRSVLYQPHQRRPLSGWSTYPFGCTKIQVDYAQQSLLGYGLINYGVRGTHSDTSMRQYYNYLTKLNLTDNFTFEELFPSNNAAGHRSLIQYLLFDLRHLMLDKIQLLRIGMEFSNADQSPVDHQIVVVSIHPNGRANVINLSKEGIEWNWEFLQQN